VALHAWVNMLPAWKGLKPPAINNQLYNSKPGWFLYDQNGKRQPLSEHYVILNPCLPEVRKYLNRICKEIVSRYPVQGLHMDYIRFVGVTDGGPDYPRDARTVALYKKDTGLEPQEDTERWNQWKTDQVTRLVAEVRATVKRAAPRTLLTAAVFKAKNAPGVYQDWPTWIAKGQVDAVFPMLYTGDSSVFRQYLGDVTEATQQRDKVFPIIGVYKQAKVEETLDQIASVESMGFPGYGLYAYSSFFRSKAPVESLEAKDPDLRVRRREALVTRPHNN
ncbi:MAG TPA: family 10 glycosylhydrolase, partial [Pseudodesulfovibrio sp.]|nr:family 10 glycosylhydrolase [Pseudodesulfovibrio sp.]